MPSIQELLQMFMQGGAGGMAPGAPPVDPRVAAMKGMVQSPPALVQDRSMPGQVPGGQFSQIPGSPGYNSPGGAAFGLYPNMTGMGGPNEGPNFDMMTEDPSVRMDTGISRRQQDERELDRVRRGMGEDNKYYDTPTDEEITAALNDPEARQAFVDKYGLPPEDFEDSNDEREPDSDPDDSR